MHGKAFKEWEKVGAMLFFRFVDSGPADIRVTFDKATAKYINEDRPMPENILGRSLIGSEEWIKKAHEALTSPKSRNWLDELGAAVFDWLGYESQWAKLQREARDGVAKNKDKPSLWIDPDPNFWKEEGLSAEKITDIVHSTTLHEIGHALGFLHWQSAGSLPAETAHTDRYSIMDKSLSSTDDQVLSPGDKKALINVYGEQSEAMCESGVINVLGSIHIYGVDDETFSDDIINERRDVDIYVGTQEEYSYVPLETFKWGGECRVEVEIGARRVRGRVELYTAEIEMSAKVRLYEGTYEETDDLAAAKEIFFTIKSKGGGKTTEKITVRNNGWGGGDHATVTLNLSLPTVPNFTISVTPGAPSLGVASSDVNGDGQVDAADLVLVSNHLGQTAPQSPPVDVNGDNIVTIADLVQVAQYLGQSTTASAPASIIVPADLEHATVEAWIYQAQLEDDGSLVFSQGIAKLEYLLTLIIPEKTALLHNYPNPFNPETWIPYHLSKAANVSLTIYTIDGKVVRRLDLGHQAAGYYQNKARAAHWDGRNSVGERVASGLYFYTLTAGDFTATRKLLIAK